MKHILILMALAAQLVAQRSEIVRVQQEPTRIMHLLTPMIPDGTKVAFDDKLKIITLNGTPEVVEMLIANIRRLDPAPSTRSIELTVHLLAGTDTDSKLPDDLSAAIKQLRGLFPFKGYQLLDTTIHRSLDGMGGMTNASIPGATPGTKASGYSIQYNTATAEGEPGQRRIAIMMFDFRTTAPSSRDPAQTDMAMLRTDVSLREGAKAVIGRSSLGNGKESLFVVLSAKVVD